MNIKWFILREPIKVAQVLGLLVPSVYKKLTLN
jgi:hypothetical protein